MAKRRKHLSKAHRQAISRGLQRYYRRQRAEAARAHARRSAAAKRAAATRKANRELHRIQQTKQVAPPPAPAAPPVVQEWEVTVSYTIGGKGKHRGETVDVTLRLVGRPGKQFTNAQIRAAAWFVLKHGPGSLSDFEAVEAVDWYNTRRSGATEEYHYGEGQVAEVLENARGIFYTVGIGGLRVALVE